MRSAPILSALALSVWLLTGCTDIEPRVAAKPSADVRVPCAEHSRLRRAFFGDLHVHTGFSFDAWAYENRHSPADAYRFAKGEALDLPPLGPDGQGARLAALRRPLDFAAVTDHAEFLGEMRLCTVAGSAAYDSELCHIIREDPESAVVKLGAQTISSTPVRFDLCGNGDPTCILDAAAERWGEAQAAAEEHYDRSASCDFVTFVGYEYTATPSISNNHRDVIFRGSNVPALPTTYYEAQDAWQLWAALESECLKAGTGCDVLTIAHNTNLSNGIMFQPSYPGASSIAQERAMAELRARMEPVIEIFQHKGTSECRNGFAGLAADPDPLCDLEQQWPATAEDCGAGTGAGGMRLMGCVSKLDFVRNIFKAGLAEKQRLGVNPYRLGVIADTDTHNSTAGKTDENDFFGHVGTVDDTAEKRLGAGTTTHDALINNPGGLAVVWAEERSREAIFDALRRGESYGTSGTRIELRFFGGWGYGVGLCTSQSLVEQGYAEGVPMGGDLPPRLGAGAPRFIVQAKADPGTPSAPGTLLQRTEIIKGWIDSSGQWRESVIEVSGSATNGATVDGATCEQSGPGDTELCQVWEDPDFDPSLPAFYYVRAVENPSCRWSSWECLRLPAAERPQECTSPLVPLATQEMAWSSPIWYAP